MSKLRLYNYNNYINRIFKKEATLEEYGTPIYTLSVTNFNYNDGVDTSHVINYNNQDGDYVIITDDNDNIQSRWFVTENVRNRGGQHNLTLKRDLKVDLYDLYKNSPMIVHRGWPKNTNALIFNSEGFSFNEIKKSENLLIDKSYTPWIYIYFAKNCPTASGTVTISEEQDFTINTTIEESIYANASTHKCYDNRLIFTNSDQIVDSYRIDYLKLLIKGNNSFQDIIEERSARDRDHIWFNNTTAAVTAQLTNAFYNKYSTWTNNTYFGKTNDVSGLDRDRMEIGSLIIKDSTNSLYQVTISKNVEYSKESYTLTETLTNAIQTAINGTTLDRQGNWGDEAYGIIYDEITYTISTYKITNGSLNWTIDFTSRQNTIDADYNIIAIPYNDFYALGENSLNAKIPKEWSRVLLQSILRSTYTEGGETKPLKNYIYDVQLLPYSPYPEYCDWILSQPDTGGIYIGDLSDLDIQGIKSTAAYADTSGDIGILMLYVEKSQYTFNIDNFTRFSENQYGQTISLNRVSDVLSITNYTEINELNLKIMNECNKYRLCSPNYNGLFEFSVAKNNGVEYFNVDITLRPQNPYIHLNPNFKNLYGSEFNDVRGLICQGDFSLPIVTDQWQTYEYQNKNYQNIFNRQIENMDFNFEQERIKGIFGAVAGTTVGAAAGGLTGYKTGGPVGAGVGAVLGGASSLAGGIIDYNMMTSRQEEQRDYVIDNYKYQLGNIKALSYSINKVTPYTNNNKIWPFIEIYRCTDVERQMFIDKMTYNSFTLETIGKISDYKNDSNKHFFSGTLIRVEGANQPTHELQELAKELEKGVYI